MNNRPGTISTEDSADMYKQKHNERKTMNNRHAAARGAVPAHIEAAIMDIAANLGAEGGVVQRGADDRLRLFYGFVEYVALSPRYHESTGDSDDLFAALADTLTNTKDTRVRGVTCGSAYGIAETVCIVTAVAVVLARVARIASFTRVVLDKRAAFILAVRAVLLSGTYMNIDPNADLEGV